MPRLSVSFERIAFQLTGESIVILCLLINRVISMNLRDLLNVCQTGLPNVFHFVRR
jgi:hypothetical protein